MPKSTQADVVIVGAGNAGLCAALAAAEAGASVVVLEKAPEHLRGGNTFFTGGLFRFAYDGWEDIGQLISLSATEREGVDVGRYPAAAYYEDIMRVTEGLADPELIGIVVQQSFPTMRWMREQGLPWVLAYGRQAFKEDGKLRFWGGLIVEAVGGGKGLSDRLFDLAARA
ncbi:MAG: FAD-dependent oxidoreductase, partial [Verrucomicrobia bacterium]|nr:FAD-dependent oxidoreductase [Verrucomicrobiota bacterium]